VSETPDIVAFVDGPIGRLRLNRPSAIHALTLPMVATMTDVLVAWAENPSIAAVIIDHASGRGLCAGGDVQMLRQSALHDGGVTGRRFFHDEYRLNHLLFGYAKPVVAIMDGLVMGGGVGISLPAHIRVATENTRLAMPETAIGLFPDVGGGWYLSRLPGRVGRYIALTGARLDGADCMALGLATHYLPAVSLDAAKAAIVAAPHDIIGGLSALSVSPPMARVIGQLSDIDRLFADDSLELILATLDSDRTEWATAQAALLRTKSPQSCKVALRQLRTAAMLKDFADVMRMEYRIGARVLMSADFAEGVRAVLVDKDHSPHWNPPTPEDVGDALLDAIFAKLPTDEEWTPHPAAQREEKLCNTM